MSRNCAVLGCENAAKYVRIDNFSVAGINSVAFYDECEEHAVKSSQRPATPGHAPSQYRLIRGQS